MIALAITARFVLRNSAFITASIAASIATVNDASIATVNDLGIDTVNAARIVVANAASIDAIENASKSIVNDALLNAAINLAIGLRYTAPIVVSIGICTAQGLVEQVAQLWTARARIRARPRPLRLRPYKADESGRSLAAASSLNRPQVSKREPPLRRGETVPTGSADGDLASFIADRKAPGRDRRARR